MWQIKNYLKYAAIFLFFIFASKALLAQEAAQYELRELEFQGNSYFSSAILSDVIISKQSPGWLSKSVNKLYFKLGRKPSYFDSLLIHDDLEVLRYFYQDNGFFNMRARFSYDLDTTDKMAGLFYTIDEGPHFQIRNYKFSGTASLPELISSRINDYRIDSAAYFSKALLDEKNSRLVTFLRDNGFMLARIDVPGIDVYTDSGFVDIFEQLVPGRQYSIDSLKVIKTGPGKESVDDELIKKLVGIQPQDMYSAYERQQAQIRLYRTNLFSSVLINAIVSDTLSPKVPLTINADIGTLHEFVPELIVNNRENTFNVGFGANYVKRNFFGNARTFTLSGNLAIEDIFKEGVLSNLPQFFTLNDNKTMGYVDIRAMVEQPYLFDESISSKLETFWSENKNDKYTSFTVGSRIGFDFEMPKYVYLSSLNVFYSVEGASYRFKDSTLVKELRNKFEGLSEDSAKSIIKNVRFDNSWDLTSVMGFTLGIHKTDDMLFPARGYNLSFTLEEANIIPSLLNSIGIGTKPRSLFYRIQANLSLFPAVFNSPTSAFGIKLKAGYLQTYAGESNWVPLNKRFTSGGSNSIRGWSARQLNPRSTTAMSTSSDIYDLILKDLPLGGTFLFEGSFETRNRLFGPVGMALFLDYGNVWEGYKNFSISDIAVAAGFGLRFYSSFAPIRFDVGFKAYDPHDKMNLLKKMESKHIWENIRDVMTLHIGIGEAF